MFAVFGSISCSFSENSTSHKRNQDASQSALKAAENLGHGLLPVSLHGAGFAHFPPQPGSPVSWAQMTDPQSLKQVRVVMLGDVENEEEMRELYDIPSSPDHGLCAFTSPSAKLLLDLYWKGFSDAYGDYSAQPETCLASLAGSWCFCLYDENSGYALVATCGAPLREPQLFWAPDPASGTFKFASADLKSELLGVECAAFPQGAYFTRSPACPAGYLLSRVSHTVNRDADEQPAQCSSMFRVASGSDLPSLRPGDNVAAQ